MQSIKQLIINVLDIAFILVWGHSFFDVISITLSTQWLAAFSTIDYITKLIISLLGVAWGIYKFYDFYHNSKINIAIKKEELKKLKRENREKL